MDTGFTPLRYPRCDQVSLTGRLSDRYRGNLRYLAHIYETREDWMLEPFRHRGKEWVLEPLRNKKGELAWAGEYAGKWLDAAALSASGTANQHLGQAASRFASELIATQESGGYLGIELPARRGQGSDWDWDVWNVKYAMTGLLTYFEISQDKAALDAAVRCGDWLVNQFGMVTAGDHPFFSSTMNGGSNVIVLDQLARLYRFTGDLKSLDFATSIVAYYPPLETMRKTHQAPMWHAYNLASYLGGIVELAIASNCETELLWVEQVWEDISSRHLYPTGSLSFREHLSETAPNDTPVENGEPARHHQETCATVEWLLFNASLYHATGRVRYMEHMEQTIYNALLAAQSLDGLQWMYYTPLRYEKRWFTGPTSCCYWSGPRGIARLPGWVYALDREGIRVNLYESGEANLQLNDNPVAIKQISLYPDLGSVSIEVKPAAPASFTLRLRIPPGARDVQLKLNGQPVLPDSAAAGYFTFHRTWSPGDWIKMEFDVLAMVRNFLGAHYGIIVRGPEVLAVDQWDNPAIDLDRITLREPMILRGIDPMNGRRRYQGEVTVDGRSVQVVFTPYADCGGDGARFRTAFPK
ncbi:MAG TPA: beta-L-arabinofuranosidase domain-containing protein [Anaerolineales bacterium]|nr:beta-L-arabinofuranosidase domain-containing protein [Anaerolineales bacterium]